MVTWMDAPRRSREDWITAGLAELGTVGVDQLRLDRIASDLGVTKGSFYWHFEDRDELLAAIVDGWEARCTEDVISAVDRSGPDPHDRATQLWQLTAGAPNIQAELAIRDWARRSETIASQVQRVDDRRMTYVSSLLADLGVPRRELAARSLLAYSLLLGYYLIATSQPHRKRRRIADEALRLILSSSA